MATVAFAVLTLALLAWILSPLLHREDFQGGEGHLAGELKDLYALKNVAYDTVRDVEFDYRMGKMAEVDYQELKHRYQQEAAEIVAQIQEVEGRMKQEEASPRRGGSKKARP